MGNGKEYEGVRYPRRINEQTSAQPPGRTSSASSLPPASGPPSQSGIWGPYSAGISSSTVKHTVGNDWVDQGAGCEGAAPGTAECFLDPGQRSRIATTYQARVNAAYTAYLGALSSLRVDELLKKEPEHTDVIFDILLDVVGMVTSHAITTIAKALAGGHTETITDVVANVGAVVENAHSAEAELGHVVGAGVGMAKAKATALHAAHQAAPKNANVAYLDLLGEASGVIYEHLREDMIAGVSDGALVMLFDSFRASAGHSVAAYKDEVSGKLDRFKKTKLSMIGTAKDEQKNEGIVPGDFRVDQLTKAFWVKTPMGMRLALYKRPADTGWVPDTSSAIPMSRPPNAMERASEKMRDISGESLRFVEYVPPEFVAAAVKMHIDKWGAVPTEHALGLDEIAQMGDGR